MAGPPQDASVRAPPPPARQYGQPAPQVQAESDYSSQYAQGGDAGDEDAAPWAQQAPAPPAMKPDAFASYQAYLQEANLPVPQQGMGYAPPPAAASYDPWKLGPPPQQQREVYPPSYPSGYGEMAPAPQAAPVPSFPPPRRSGSPMTRGAGLADLVGTAGAARAHAAQTMDYRRELEIQIAAQKAAKEAQRRQRQEEDAREESQISAYVDRQGLGPAPPQAAAPPRMQAAALPRQEPAAAPRLGRARVPGASSLAQTLGDDVASSAAAKRAAAAAHSAELQAQIEARAAARVAAERKAKEEDEAENARVLADMAVSGLGRGPVLATAAEEDVSMIAANREFAEGGGVLPSPPRMRAPPPLPPWAMPQQPAPRAAAAEAAPQGQSGAGGIPRTSVMRSSVTREEVDRLRAALAARDAALEAAMVAAASAEQRAAAARAGVAMPRGGPVDDSLLRAYAAARFGGAMAPGGMPPMMPYAAPPMMGYGAPWGQPPPVPYGQFYPPQYPGYGMMPPPFMGPPPGGEAPPPMTEPSMQAEPERSASPEDLFPDSIGRTRTARGGTRRSHAPVDLSGASGSVDLAASLASDSTFVYPLAGREYASTPARTTRASGVAPPLPPQRVQTPIPEVPAAAQLPLAFGSPSMSTGGMGSPPSAPPLSPVPVPDASPLPLPHAEVSGPRVSSVGAARMSAYGDLDADVDAALERTVDAVEWSATASGDLQTTLRRLDAVLPVAGQEVPPEGLFGDSGRPRTAESRPQSTVGDLPPRRPTTAGGGGRSKMAGWFKGEQQ